jgi:hypothetical protein
VTRRHDGGNRRDDAGIGTPSSVPEVGRLLRRARTRQGLRLEDVAARTGLNLHQLEALETGTVDRIPDRVVVLKTLRRYADSLGLPGDRFVLALVDHWPSPAATPPVVSVPPRPMAAAPVAAVGAAATFAVHDPPAPTDVVPAAAVTRIESPALVTPRPTGVASTTAQVNAVASTTGQVQAVPTTGQVQAVPNTGVVPAVRSKPAGTARRRRPAVGLSVAVGILGVAVVLGVGALLVHHYEPHWLVDIGVTNSPTTTTGTHGGSTTTTTHHTTTPPANAVTVTTTSANAANLAVHASTFQVTLTAIGGSSWVQATQSGQPTPIFSGVLAPGQTKVFPVDHPLQVEVGSVAAHVVVSTGLHRLGSYVPPAAPFTMTFSGTS